MDGPQNSVSFDGIDDQVVLPPAALDGLNEFTISIWAKADVSLLNNLIGGSNPSSASELWLYVYGGGVTLSVDASTSFWSTGVVIGEKPLIEIIPLTKDSGTFRTYFRTSRLFPLFKSIIT